MRRTLVTTICLLFSPQAFGAGNAEKEAAKDYRWQVLAADVASLALLLGGGISDNDALVWGGFAGYLFLAPAVHGAHGEPDRMLSDERRRKSSPGQPSAWGGRVSGWGVRLSARAPRRDGLV